MFVGILFLAVGTSSAMKKKQKDLVVGNLIGSNIIDTTLALSFGPLFFPYSLHISIIKTGIAMLLATIISISLISWRQRIDRSIGLSLIVLYGLMVFLAFLL